MKKLIEKIDTPYYVIPSWCPFEDIGEENEEISD